MNNQGKQILAFLAGAAAGAIVTYLLTTDKGGDVVEDFKDLARKVKDGIAEQLNNIQTQKSAREERETEEDMMGVGV